MRAGSRSAIAVECAECGKRLMRWPSRIKTRKRLFCSRACAGIAQRKFKDTTNASKAERACLQCGKAFMATQVYVNVGKGNYCSAACRNASRVVPRVRGAYKDKDLGPARHCAECGASFRPHRWDAEDGGGIYCSRRCSAKAAYPATLGAITTAERRAMALKTFAVGKLHRLTHESGRVGREFDRAHFWTSGSTSIEARRAYRFLSEALSAGRIARGSCEQCGSDRRVAGHHEDYSRALDVVWLCPKCHRAWHRFKGGNPRVRREQVTRIIAAIQRAGVLDVA